MSKRELRQMQIAEILGQDRFINQKVANLNKKAVERYDSDLVPVPANDQQVLGGVDTLVEKLNSLLYNKVSLLESVPQNIDRFLDLYDYKSIISNFIEINKVDDILTLYNSIVKQYLVPSTMTNVSKSLIRNKLASCLTNLTNLYDKLERIIIIYVKQFNVFPQLAEADPAGQGGTKQLRLINIARVISRCLSTFSVYRMIKEQIQDDKYHIIEISDFEHEVQKLSDKNPLIRKFLEKIKELEPRIHSRKYPGIYSESPEGKAFLESDEGKQKLEEAVNEELPKAIQKWKNEHGGREPSQLIKNSIKHKLEQDLIYRILPADLKRKVLEDMKKGRLQTENAYEIELGRQMTPDERRHLFNMNRAEQPDEPIRIIQPPAYFDNAQERIRDNERATRFRQYNEELVRRRDRERARRIEEGEVDMFDPEGDFFFE